MSAVALPRRGTLIALLALAALTAACADSPTAPGESLACNTTVGNLSPGDTVTGVLTRQSCRLTDGSYADRWRLVLDASAILTLDMLSDDVDAYLIVRDASGTEIVADDDGAGGSDARITYGFAAGTYYVLANTFYQDEFGGYTIIVE
jgi:hypothetical protein